MVKKFLKIAGVKNEKEFYNKYPTEAAFFKAHPEAKDLKKFKQGGQQKKLDQLTSYEGDIDGLIPIAVNGIHKLQNADKAVEKAATTEFGRDRKCGITSAYAAEDRAVARQMRKEDKEIAKEAAASDRAIAEQKAKEWADYINPGIDPYGEKYGRKDKTFSENYNRFITANPQFAQEKSSLGLSPEQRYAMLYKMAGRSGSPLYQATNRLKSYMGIDPSQRFTDQQLYEAVNKMGGVDKYADWWKGGWSEIPRQDYGGETPIGSYVGGEQDVFEPVAFGDVYKNIGARISGVNPTPAQTQQGAASRQPSSGGGLDLGQIAGAVSQIGSLFGKKKAKGGDSVPRFQNAPFGIPSTTYVPGQGVPSVPMYTPGATGISGNILNMGYGQQQATVGGVPVFPQATSVGNIGGYNLPSNFFSMNYKGIGSKDFGKSITPNFFDKMGGIQGVANIAGGILGGLGELKAEKAARKDAETAAKISELVAQAASMTPEMKRRRYVRPEDDLFQPEQMFPSYGVGTNVLARNGRQIGGNITEIQNMYNPGDIYQDLGYEPLSESDVVKQYREGGYIPQAQLGNIIGTASNAIGGLMGLDNAGGSIGGAIGSVFGPVGSAFGSLIGGALDKNAAKTAAAQKKTKFNMERAAMMSGIKGITGQYSAHMEDGGWVSHDWQPQVITQFGEHRMQDLLSEDPMMDTLRTGGNIRQNNIYQQDQYALGGELQTTWGGHAEPISYNPYLPGTGETVMFRGQSHEESDGKGRTGIGVKYGNDGQYNPYMEYGKNGVEDVTDVEVERNEPATEMIDGQTGEKNMIVFGNLKISKESAAHIGDKNAAGKKFKHYVKGLGEQENKQNKIMEKAISGIENTNTFTPFDMLKLNSYRAMMDGANNKLKEIAEYKMNASNVQNAINETAEEHGLVADDLAVGKIKQDKKAMQGQAKWGSNVEKAQDGKKTRKAYALEEVPKGQHKGKTFYGKVTQDAFKKLIDNNTWYDFTYFDPTSKRDVRHFQRSFNKTSKAIGSSARLQEDGLLGEQTASARMEDMYDRTPGIAEIKLTAPTAEPAAETKVVPIESKKKKQNWLGALNTLLPYLGKPIEGDMPDLYPEMMALAMNKLEPVPAQLYHPDLGTPYDISLQDQLNANQADFNSMQRMMGYNPAALSSLAAQKYAANTGVLGQQFRLNQAEKQRVYEGNRALLNDAKLKNLAILDTQMERFEKAKSITKATALEAMKSMSDKIARKKLEDKQMAVYQNMYPNYRLTRDMRLVPRNLTLFNTETGYGGQTTTGTPSMAIPATQTTQAAQPQQTAPVAQPTYYIPPFLNPNTPADQPYSPFFTPPGQKNGGKTNKKDQRNSSLVKAIKNL